MIETTETVDMSVQAVTSRLRVACKPKPKAGYRPLVPMDSRSVSARLRSVSEMSSRCSVLGRGAMWSAPPSHGSHGSHRSHHSHGSPRAWDQGPAPARARVLVKA
jgi:hypothetical protein